MAFLRERGRTYIFRSMNLEMFPLSELNSTLNYILFDECLGQKSSYKIRSNPHPPHHMMVVMSTFAGNVW